MEPDSFEVSLIIPREDALRYRDLLRKFGNEHEKAEAENMSPWELVWHLLVRGENALLEERHAAEKPRPH